VCGELELKDQKTSDVKWVKCDVCQKWHHIACIGLDDKDYEFLKRAKKNNKHIFWLCNDCKVASRYCKGMLPVFSYNDTDSAKI